MKAKKVFKQFQEQPEIAKIAIVFFVLILAYILIVKLEQAYNSVMVGLGLKKSKEEEKREKETDKIEIKDDSTENQTAIDIYNELVNADNSGKDADFQTVLNKIWSLDSTFKAKVLLKFQIYTKTKEGNAKNIIQWANDNLSADQSKIIKYVWNKPVVVLNNSYAYFIGWSYGTLYLTGKAKIGEQNTLTSEGALYDEQVLVTIPNSPPKWTGGYLERTAVLPIEVKNKGTYGLDLLYSNVSF